MLLQGVNTGGTEEKGTIKVIVPSRVGRFPFKIELKIFIGRGQRKLIEKEMDCY